MLPRPGLHNGIWRRLGRGASPLEGPASTFPEPALGHQSRPIMALKKSELYSSLWASCDALRCGKEMVERLTNLIAIFENKALDFSKNRADGDDILGDAYEYLMRHFATESGKSKGAVLHPRRSQPHHGEDHRHPRREDQCRHNRLRSDLRFRLPALEGGR